MTPNISTASTGNTFPVLGSGRNNSMIFPRDTTISCCFVPEKKPWIAWLIVEALCRVRPYKCILTYQTQLIMNALWISQAFWLTENRTIEVTTGWLDEIGTYSDWCHFRSIAKQIPTTAYMMLFHPMVSECDSFHMLNPNKKLKTISLQTRSADFLIY